ncbi:recombinase family protein, partial [Rhizobium favelukesii]|uniref:recombinase family protein n=1 Tax=Rhizobium favelukesii TaxID=348824 RepID=UPI00215E4608
MRRTYGYRYIRKTRDAPARYEIDTAEAEVVRLVYDKYTVDGLSIGAIARLLREMGLPTRRRVTRWERSSGRSYGTPPTRAPPASTRRK